MAYLVVVVVGFAIFSLHLYRHHSYSGRFGWLWLVTATKQRQNVYLWNSWTNCDCHQALRIQLERIEKKKYSQMAHNTKFDAVSTLHFFLSLRRLWISCCTFVNFFVILFFFASACHKRFNNRNLNSHEEDPHSSSNHAIHCCLPFQAKKSHISFSLDKWN